MSVATPCRPAAPRPRRPGVALACVLLLASPLLVASAAPAEGPIDEVAPCLVQHVDGLGPACLREDGLWDVVLADGTRLPTHGMDPLEHDHGPSMGLGDPERAPSCATDFYQHVLYARTAGYPDRLADVKASLQAAMRRMDHVLHEDAMESGGVGADFKVLCDAAGDVRVDSLVVNSTSVEYATIVSAAKAAGFNATNADYTIFMDRGHASYCGVGTLYRDDRPGAENWNNVATGYAVTYVGCWNGRTVMHEVGHNQGAVQELAPGWDGDAHCIEQYDVMCYWYDHNLDLCMDRIRFDCGYDTYFDAKPELAEWLSSHWNVGGRANRFVRFGDQAPVPPQPPVLGGLPGDGQAQLSWTTPADNGYPLVGYRLYRDGVLHRDLGVQNGHVDANVTNGQTYRYRVSAVSTAGEGARSNEVALTPNPPNEPPTACFAWTSDNATVSVDAACATDPDGSLLQWTWSWGDGTADSTGRNATHTYAVGGNFTVRLTVTDDRGATATTAQNVTVAGPHDPDSSVQTLLPGQGVTHNVSGVGSWRHYKMFMPPGQPKIQVDMWGSSCTPLLCDPDIDLYLRRGAKPTTAAYDCSPIEGGQREICIRYNPVSDWWYFSVHVASGAGTATYSIKAYW